MRRTSRRRDPFETEEETLHSRPNDLRPDDKPKRGFGSGSPSVAYDGGRAILISSHFGRGATHKSIQFLGLPSAGVSRRRRRRRSHWSFPAGRPNCLPAHARSKGGAVAAREQRSFAHFCLQRTTSSRRLYSSRARTRVPRRNSLLEFCALKNQLGRRARQLSPRAPRGCPREEGQCAPNQRGSLKSSNSTSPQRASRHERGRHKGPLLCSVARLQRQGSVPFNCAFGSRAQSNWSPDFCQLARPVVVTKQFRVGRAN